MSAGLEILFGSLPGWIWTVGKDSLIITETESLCPPLPAADQVNMRLLPIFFWSLKNNNNSSFHELMNLDYKSLRSANGQPLSPVRVHNVCNVWKFQMAQDWSALEVHILKAKSSIRITTMKGLLLQGVQGSRLTLPAGENSKFGWFYNRFGWRIDTATLMNPHY